MIVTLPNTSTAEVGRALVDIREEGGAVALGRVLSLVILAPDCDVERPIEAANAASMEHPCRVIAIASASQPDEAVSPREGAGASGAAEESRLDAEVRVGGDAGASEVIVLRPHGGLMGHLDSLITPLLLPDAPTVAWWPGSLPSAPVALEAVTRRWITDTKSCPDPMGALRALRSAYHPGDTDLAWARITLWRAQLTAALDVTRVPVQSVTVAGRADHPSCWLLAAWLGDRLGVSARVEPVDAEAITTAELTLPNGVIRLHRPDGADSALLTAPGQVEHEVALTMRSLPECLSEELRSLQEDPVYGETLTSRTLDTLLTAR